VLILLGIVMICSVLSRAGRGKRKSIKKCVEEGRFLLGEVVRWW